MTIKRRHWIPFLVVALLVAAVAVWVYSEGGPPFTPEEARRALLQSRRSSTGSDWGLETEPLVVRTTPDGREEWVIGHWTIDPVAQRFHYFHPGYRMLHLEHAGCFYRSWRVWRVTIDSWRSVYYAPVGSRSGSQAIPP